jgi:hypothetical protein
MIDDARTAARVDFSGGPVAGADRFAHVSIFVGRCALPMAWQSVRLWSQSLRSRARLGGGPVVER